MPLSVSSLNAHPDRYSDTVDASGGKSLTPSVYRKLSSGFASLWGDEAGWAHSLLFNDKIKTRKRTAAKKARHVK